MPDVKALSSRDGDRFEAEHVPYLRYVEDVGPTVEHDERPVRRTAPRESSNHTSGPAGGQSYLVQRWLGEHVAPQECSDLGGRDKLLHNTQRVFEATVPRKMPASRSSLGG